MRIGEETFICLQLYSVLFLHATERQGMVCSEYKSQEMARNARKLYNEKTLRKKWGQNKH